MTFWSLSVAASKWIETHSPYQGLKGYICYPYAITEHPNVFVAPHLAPWDSHTQTRWLIVAPCVECLLGWGMENSSSLPLPHFLQASGIHWVGVRLLDSVVASWLGRRGEMKGCSGIFTHGGSLATQRLLVFVFVCISVECNWRQHGERKEISPFFGVFCLFWILNRLNLFWAQSMCSPI